MIDFMSLIICSEIVVAQVDNSDQEAEEECPILTFERRMSSQNRSDDSYAITSGRGKQKSRGPTSPNGSRTVDSGHQGLDMHAKARGKPPESTSTRNVNSSPDRIVLLRNDIQIAEIHQEIANSSIPIPLRTIMKTWKNVPKLHQYQPTDLQVLYHRKSGHVETVQTGNSKISSVSTGNNPEQRNANEPLANQQISDLRPVFSNVEEIGPKPEMGMVGCNKTDYITEHEQSSQKQQINVLNTIPNCSRVVKATQTEQRKLFSTECQTAMQMVTTGCQTEKVMLVSEECQTTDNSNIIELKSSASTSTETNTSPADFSATKSTATEIWSNAAEVQATTSVCDVDSQTDAEASTTKCDDSIHSISSAIQCQLMQKEFEEKIDSLTNLLKSTEEDLQSTKDELIRYHSGQYAMNNTCHNDGSTINETMQLSVCDPFLQQELVTRQDTNAFSAKQENAVDLNSKKILEELSKYETMLVHAEEEKSQLTAKVQHLQTQVDSFQNGMNRLRNAIEKPVPNLSGVSDETIQEVLHKAESFISSYSDSHARVAKINNRLSTLSNSVSYPNGEPRVSDISGDSAPRDCP